MGLGGSERRARTCPIVTQWAGGAPRCCWQVMPGHFTVNSSKTVDPQVHSWLGCREQTDWHQNEGATPPPTPYRALSLQCHHQIHSQTLSPLLRFLLCLFFPISRIQQFKNACRSSPLSTPRANPSQSFPCNGISTADLYEAIMAFDKCLQLLNTCTVIFCSVVTSFERMTEQYVWCYYLWLTTGSAKRKCKQSSQYKNPWLLFLQQPWHQVISYHKLKNAFPFISESNTQEKAEKNLKAVSGTSLSAHFKLDWYDMKKSQKQWKIN